MSYNNSKPNAKHKGSKGGGKSHSGTMGRGGGSAPTHKGTMGTGKGSTGHKGTMGTS